jgi:hypothetical protein
MAPMGRGRIHSFGHDYGWQVKVLHFLVLLMLSDCIHGITIREYDISLDTEEPQQVLTFMHQRAQGAYLAEHISEREVASFTLGKGKADWGPLTVYAITKSGDVYSICPYMPKNA